MLRILKNHVDRLVLEYDFFESDNIFMGYLSVELLLIEGRTARETRYTHCNFADCTLADTCIRRHITVLVRFELFDCMKFGLLVLALGFIDTAIRSGGNETKDGIFRGDATMGLVTFGTVNTHHIMWYYLRPVVNHEMSVVRRVTVNRTALSRTS